MLIILNSSPSDILILMTPFLHHTSSFHETIAEAPLLLPLTENDSLSPSVITISPTSNVFVINPAPVIPAENNKDPSVCVLPSTLDMDTGDPDMAVKRRFPVTSEFLRIKNVALLFPVPEYVWMRHCVELKWLNECKLYYV